MEPFPSLSTRCVCSTVKSRNAPAQDERARQRVVYHGAMKRDLLRCLAVAVALLGCGSSPAATHCASSAECDNGLYCDGIELCNPGSPGADAKGCVTFALPACLSGMVCSNYDQRCIPACTGSLIDFPGCARACSRDNDCDDGVFCNGTARCVGVTAALKIANGDARGCAIEPHPCGADQTCDEAANKCTTNCPDADQDHHRDHACGGDDCDDADPTRYPGAPELCDAANKDEDCDPSTFGHKDLDGDGFDSSVCCNGTNCGTDCNDAKASVHPGANEVCNHIDDTCVGAIDDGVSVSTYVDADRDGYGTGPAVPGCPGDPGYSLLNNDCDDAFAGITPGAIVCQPAVGPTNYALCTREGVYLPSKCPGQMTCHPQPNGQGVCF
jgi:hypothetical protein